jgi:hypothetical protein
MNPRVGLSILRVVLGLVTGAYALALAVAQLRGSTHYVLLLLALAELAATILFFIPRTVRLGGSALILVFGVAALIHIIHGEYSIGYLTVYSAAAFAVISSGGRA